MPLSPSFGTPLVRKIVFHSLYYVRRKSLFYALLIGSVPVPISRHVYYVVEEDLVAWVVCCVGEPVAGLA